MQPVIGVLTDAQRHNAIKPKVHPSNKGFIQWGLRQRLAALGAAPGTPPPLPPPAEPPAELPALA